jgi:hypothetical protein
MAPRTSQCSERRSQVLKAHDFVDARWKEIKW